VPFTRLARAELLLFLLLIAHTVDHAVNQPARELPAGSGVVGIAGFVLVAVAIVFALGRGRLAAPVGLLAGAATVLGFLVVHIPGTGPLADPYPDFGPNALSWLLVAAPIVAAAAVAVLAAAELRRPRPKRRLEPGGSPAGSRAAQRRAGRFV